jgi:signal transduction histidine kinase
LIVYLVAWLGALGSTLRYTGHFVGHPSQWTIFGLLAAFYILLAAFPWVSRRSQPYLHLYLTVQSGILVALTLVTTIEDVLALPFLSLILLSMNVLPPKIGFAWIGVFTVLMACSMVIYGIRLHGIHTGMILLTALVYLTCYLGFGTSVVVIRQLEIARSEAEGARKESEALLADLRAAHQRLQDYTEQAEQVAVVQERQRLARELHDSVTQSLHSSTLMAEAGQRLADAGDLERTKHYLNRLGEISQQALREMRLMVYELRPLALREAGLVGALQQRLDAVERRAGIDARLTIEGGPKEGQAIDLKQEVEEALYRIAQEALNNALKHAEPSSVTVTLRLEGQVELVIADDGSGFDPGAVDGAGGIGLDSMRERAEEIGGVLTIDSAPGEGTRIQVSVG